VRKKKDSEHIFKLSLIFSIIFHFLLLLIFSSFNLLPVSTEAYHVEKEIFELTIIERDSLHLPEKNLEITENKNSTFKNPDTLSKEPNRKALKIEAEQIKLDFENKILVSSLNNHERLKTTRPLTPSSGNDSVIKIHRKPDDYFLHNNPLPDKLATVTSTPIYPKKAANHLTEGSVKLLAAISREGEPEAVEVVKSSGNESLDEQSLFTIENICFFNPFRIPYQIYVNIIFSTDNVELVFDRILTQQPDH